MPTRNQVTKLVMDQAGDICLKSRFATGNPAKADIENDRVALIKLTNHATVACSDMGVTQIHVIQIERQYFFVGKCILGP